MLTAWRTRLTGAWLMLRMLLRSDDLAASYAFLAHARVHLFEPGIGMGRAILQGVWDRYPGVPPTRRELELLLEHDPPRPGDALLDVGCGEGALLELAFERAPHLGSYTAIDLLPRHVARTRQVVDALDERQRGKVRLEQGDACLLAELLEVAARGPSIDKAYLVELSQDVPTADFTRLFDAVYQVVRPGGLIALAVLATSRAPRGRRERLIFDTIVRPSAPRAQDLAALFARYDCQVTEHDVTAESSRRGGEYLLSHPERLSAALLWPFDVLFRSSVRAGLEVIASKAYSVRLVYLRKR